MSEIRKMNGIRKMKKIKMNIISFTDVGSRLNAHLKSQLAEAGMLCEGYAVKRFARLNGLHPLEGDIRAWIGARWGGDAFLFIGATGIAVRYIAPWVKDKFTDSPVLVMDEKGEFIIPLLSGHVGGAVDMAAVLADLTGAVPVITTATDVQRRFAVDVFARNNGLEIGNRELAKGISAAVLEGKDIGFYSSLPVEGALPGCIKRCHTAQELMRYPYAFAVIEANRDGEPTKEWERTVEPKSLGLGNNSHILMLTFEPRIIVGIGCRRGTTAERLKAGLLEVLEPFCMLPEQIEAIASIELKKEEQGLIQLAEELQVPFRTFTAEELGTIEEVSVRSAFVERTAGVDNVCERSARYVCPSGELLLPKTVVGGSTFSLVKQSKTLIF